MKLPIRPYIADYPVSTLLGRLVQIDTQNPPGNEKAAALFLQRFFGKWQGSRPELELSLLDHGGERASLLAKLRGKSRLGLAFVGHLDTVPAEDPAEWTRPPLGGVVEQGRMYGRGTSDMKGGDAAILMAASYFLDNRIEAPRDLYFIFTADEETGSLGIREVVGTGVFEKIHEVLIGEPTDNRVGVFQKGAIGIDLGAKGKAAHAALPEQGVNAIELLGRFVDRLKAECSTGRRSCFGDRLSVCTTKIKGGIKNNVVPPEASCHIDVRTVHPDEHREVLEKIERIAGEMKAEHGVRIEFAVHQNRLPLQMGPDAGLLCRLRRIYSELGLAYKTTSIPYYTDMEEIAKQHPLPFAILGPGVKEMAHQTDEFIELDSVKRSAEIYIRYALDQPAD